MRYILIASAVLAAGCTGGKHYTGLDDDDAAVADIDADPTAIDARLVDADPSAPDAEPPDAMVPAGPLVTNGQNAELVLGQPNFTSATEDNGGVSAHALDNPVGVTSDGTYLWTIDSGNHRALRWEPLPVTNNSDADQVLGHTLFTDGTDPGATGSATTLRIPNQVAIAGGKLVISEGNRVLIWTSLPTSNGQAANRVLCQTTLAGIASGNAAGQCNAPKGVWTDGVKLAIADMGNNRVLIWTTFPTANGEAADIVLGQTDFGLGTTPSSATASNMWFPRSVYSDGTRFYVTDGNQNRVMVWNSFPTTNNQAANFVLGQPDLTSKTAAVTQAGLQIPYDVTVVGDAVFVSDMTNDRVMIWQPIPTSSGAAAAFVLGVNNFTTAGGSPTASQASLDAPMGLRVVGDKLYVVDYNHHRVMRYGLNLP